MQDRNCFGLVLLLAVMEERTRSQEAGLKVEAGKGRKHKGRHAAVTGL